MTVRLDKSFLVHILGILFVAEHVERQPEHTLVVAAHQGIKGRTLPFLGLSDQLIVLDALLRTKPRVGPGSACCFSRRAESLPLPFLATILPPHHVNPSQKGWAVVPEGPKRAWMPSYQDEFQSLQLSFRPTPESGTMFPVE